MKKICKNCKYWRDDLKGYYSQRQCEVNGFRTEACEYKMFSYPEGSCDEFKAKESY